MSSPKTFISYSWDNPNQEWISKLAKDLVENGVDVSYDKWDLKLGHEIYNYMEKMVTDPEIKKVIIISDRSYVEKADNRRGGVGAETQIISGKIYESVEQDKFVAIATEKDEEGQPCLPLYCKSRKCIDFSEQEKYEEKLEELLRWILEKPKFIKPEIGEKPHFASDDRQMLNETTTSSKEVIDAIREGKSCSVGFLDDYLEDYAKNLDNFRIKEYDGEFDDAVIRNIEAFIPYRDDAIKVFIAIAKYDSKKMYINSLHKFFESLLPYMDRPEGVTTWNSNDFDNFKFIIHELFLYTIAFLIKFERFEEASILINEKFYAPNNAEYGRDTMVYFPIFMQNMYSLENRKMRLKLSHISLRSDLLKERCQTTMIDFKYIMQADFVLFVRDGIHSDDPFFGWYPETLIYHGQISGPFELFARSESLQYFNRMRCLLDIETPNDIKPFLEKCIKDRKNLPGWPYTHIDVEQLLNIGNLATKP